MPHMRFFLEDGKPPVCFDLNNEDAERFQAFMGDCYEAQQIHGDLVAALTEATQIIEKHTYPTPDKPNSRWARLQAMKEVLGRAK